MFHAGMKEDHLPGKPRYVLRNARIVNEGVADPYTPVGVTVVKGPEHVVVDVFDAFDWTPTIIISLVAIILMSVLIAWKLHEHRPRSVLPSESGANTFTLPLSVASMGLSISLVHIIAAVAFSLAHTAGQSATSTALDDGRAATMQTYRNAQDNVQDQARRLTKVVTNLVITELLKHIETGERGAKAAAMVYADTDPSWASWNSVYNSFVDTVRPYCCHDSILATPLQGGWAVSMLSVKGFFADHAIKTDDRTDAQRGDGLPHVSVTENASVYGIVRNFAMGPGNVNVPLYCLFPPSR